MNRALLSLPLLLPLGFALACTTPQAVGERLYREGDRLGALEAWRAVPKSSFEYGQAQERIAVVQAESAGLVTRYKKSAGYFEDKERLAEAILDYRLVLKLQLQPDDSEILDHVQVLARKLASRKAALGEEYEAAIARSDLASARKHLDQQLRLDPFDPILQTEKRMLNDAIRPIVTQGLADGSRLFRAHDLAAAEQRFDSVLELEPKNASAQGYLSTIQREREAASARSATFSSRERLESEDDFVAEGFYENALKAKNRGDWYEAIKLYEHALKVNPRRADAERDLKRLRRQHLGRAEGLIEEGRQFYRKEDLRNARDSWKKALLIDPDNQRAQAYLERAELQLQNLKRLRSEPDVASRGE